MGIYEDLGVTNESVADAGTQGTGFELVPPAVYDAEVVQAYSRKTDSGAKMFSMLLNVKTQDGPTELFWETCTHAGDAKANKPTFGVGVMIHFLQACKLGDTETTIGQVNHKGTMIEALGVPAATGAKIKIGLKHEENLFNGSINEKHLIEAFMDKDGKNSDGEEIATKIAEKIAKNPIKKLKVAATPAAGTPADAAAKTAAKQGGW